MTHAELLNWSLQAQEAVARIIQAREDGNAEALSVHIALHGLKKAVEEAMEQNKEAACEEAQKRKGEVLMNKQIGYTEGKRMYDYTNCPMVMDLSKRLKDEQEKAVALILAVGSGGSVVDPETGEVLQAAIEKRGASTITLTEPK